MEIQKLNGAQSQALAAESRGVLEGPLQGLTNLPGMFFFPPDIQSNPPLAQLGSFSSISVTFPREGTSPFDPRAAGIGVWMLLPDPLLVPENCPEQQHPNLSVTANVCGSDPSLLLEKWG